MINKILVDYKIVVLSFQEIDSLLSKKLITSLHRTRKVTIAQTINCLHEKRKEIQLHKFVTQNCMWAVKERIIEYQLKLVSGNLKWVDKVSVLSKWSCADRSDLWLPCACHIQGRYFAFNGQLLSEGVTWVASQTEWACFHFTISVGTPFHSSPIILTVVKWADKGGLL